MGRSVPADLGGDCRAAAGHPAPGGGPAQKVTEPEAVPHPPRGQDLPAQRGTLQGPGSRAPRRGTGLLLRFLRMTHPLVEQGCCRTATPPLTPGPRGRSLVWLTWDSPPAPLPPGTVRPHRRGSPVRGNHCCPEAEAGSGTVGLGSGQEGRGRYCPPLGPLAACQLPCWLPGSRLVSSVSPEFSASRWGQWAVNPCSPGTLWTPCTSIWPSCRLTSPARPTPCCWTPSAWTPVGS